MKSFKSDKNKEIKIGCKFWMQIGKKKGYSFVSVNCPQTSSWMWPGGTFRSKMAAMRLCDLSIERDCGDGNPVPIILLSHLITKFILFKSPCVTRPNHTVIELDRITSYTFDNCSVKLNQNCLINIERFWSSYNIDALTGVVD